MAFAQIESLRGQGGTTIALATPPQFYKGPYAGSGYVRITAGQNEINNYGLPWKNDDSGLLYYNRNLAADEYTDLTARGAVVLNELVVNGGKTLTFTLKNGYKFLCQNASPQFRFVDPNNNVITFGNLLAATNSYVHYLAVIMDFDAHEAKIGYYYFTPSFTGSGYVGWNFPSDQNTQATRQAIYTALIANMPPVDPYNNGGYSSADGGGGGQTFSSDAVGEPSEPTLSPQGSRLLTIYKVDSATLASFANYLWAGGIDFATLHNIFNDTMGAVISLAVCPYTPAASVPQNLWFGNFDSGVSAYLVDSQYDTVDCGSVTLSEEYQSALDYNPYCKIELCLPYCGNINLDPDEFMGTTVSVKYKVDLLTGACLACVFADGVLMVQMAGNILASIPVTNADHKSIVSSIAGTAIAATGAALSVATGGMTAPAAATTAATVTAANTLNMKERYSHGGSGNGNTALLGTQKPYMIIKWVRQCLPTNNAKYQGYPSMITSTLGDLTGYTKVHEIHLEDIPCTKGEREELESILKGGVII